MLTSEDKEWLRDNCGKIERFGLYILVIVTLLHGCDTNLKVTHIEQKN